MKQLKFIILRWLGVGQLVAELVGMINKVEEKRAKDFTFLVSVLNKKANKEGKK